MPAVETARTEARTDESFYRDLLIARYHEVEDSLRCVARRQRLGVDEAEELGSIVRLKLVEDSYAILRKYQGRSSLTTYLTKVISRILLDWRAARWGRWRASAAARRLGPTAVLFEVLTRRDGLTFAEACETLRTNYLLPASLPELAVL